MKYRHVSLLSVGHLTTDINQGALPAMLPFFIAAYDLSYAAAAGIVFAANMTSSIVQPLFGLAADRFSKPYRVGLSSGVTLGLSVAIGGGAAPIIGKIADIYGIWYSLAAIAFLPIFISAVALSLPSSQKIIAKIDNEKPLTTVQNA